KKIIGRCALKVTASVGSRDYRNYLRDGCTTIQATVASNPACGAVVNAWCPKARVSDPAPAFEFLPQVARRLSDQDIMRRYRMPVRSLASRQARTAITMTAGREIAPSRLESL